MSGDQERSNITTASQARRRRAEELLGTTRTEIATMGRDDVQRLIHELQIHQIELELQNEELRRAQAELAESRDQYADLYEFAPVGYVTLNQNGKIGAANLTVATMLGVERNELLKSHLSSFVSRESQDRFFLHRQEVFSGERKQTVEIEMHKADGAPLAVRLESLVGDVRGDRLCHTALIDITERKQAEAKLVESEERLRLAQQAARVGTFEWNLQTGVNTWTQELEALYGLAPGEFAKTQQAWEQLVHPDDRPATLRLVEQTFQTGKPAQGEWRVIWPDGSLHWLAGRWQVFKDEVGNPVRMTGVNFDITERKKAEAELRHSEDQFRTVVESVPNGILSVDGEGRIVLVNGQIERQFGYRREELIGHPVERLLPRRFRRDHAGLREAYQEAPEARAMGRGRDLYGLRKDGSELPVEIGLSPIETISGRRVLASVVDITERKQAEAALRRSEEQLELVTNAMPALLFYLDADQRYRSVNDAFRHWFGVSREQVLGRTVREFVGDAAWSVIGPQLARAYRGETVEYEAQVTYPCGTSRWIHPVYTPHRDASGTVLGMVVLINDVTANKQAEAKLLESEERLRLANLATNEAIWDWDVASDTVVWNQNTDTLFGWSEAVHSPRTAAWWVERVHPDDRTRVVDHFFAAVNEPGVSAWSDEYRFQKSDGTYAHVLDRGCALRDTAGKAVRMLGTMLDITERKRAEEALRVSEERLRLAQSAARIGTFDWDIVGETIMWQPDTERLWGLREGEFKGTYEHWRELVHPEDLPKAEAILRKVLADPDECYTFEHRVIWPDGMVRWIFAKGTTVWDGGKPIRMVGLNMDITERKQTEEALRRSEHYYRTLVEATSAVTWSCLSDGLHVKPQPSWMAFTGQSAEEMLGAGWTPVVHPDDLEKTAERWNKAVATGETFTNEHRIRRHDGEWRWMSVYAAPIRDTDERVLEWSGMNIDITDRKRAEAEQQKFVSLADQSLEFIGMCDLNFKPFYVNEAGRRLVGLDSLEQACAVRVQDYFFPEDQVMIIGEFFPRVLRQGHGEIEVRFRHFKTGQALWMMYNVFQVKDENGGVVGYATVSRDITERKRAEEALRRLNETLEQRVAERTAALYEKQQALERQQTQLQALTSQLLTAQDDERRRIARELHDDHVQRLAALALDLHQLSRSGLKPVGPAKAAIAQFARSVEHLAIDLQRVTHQLHPSTLAHLGLEATLRDHVEEFGRRTGLETDVEVRHLSSELADEPALCLFRVLQECLQNVRKHAHASKVLVRLLGTNRGLGLCVRDDGRGFDDAQDVSGGGRGLGLISLRERLEALHGTFRVKTKPGDGTEVHAWLPLGQEEVSAEKGGDP